MAAHRWRRRRWWWRWRWRRRWWWRWRWWWWRRRWWRWWWWWWWWWWESFGPEEVIRQELEGGPVETSGGPDLATRSAGTEETGLVRLTYRRWQIRRRRDPRSGRPRARVELVHEIRAVEVTAAVGVATDGVELRSGRGQREVGPCGCEGRTGLPGACRHVQAHGRLGVGGRARTEPADDVEVLARCPVAAEEHARGSCRPGGPCVGRDVIDGQRRGWGRPAADHVHLVVERTCRTAVPVGEGP
jgi:hypothetical protein